ncbi:MAG: hypothetical protein CL840_17745 [Crocinitomicaceae bacterium]|nr:hypothetical protein [Crocinitomicaceae bacterium]|tara:strand:+ start:14638 stop:15147 length:510 start_codon:yes stop_codon:yes gene_type:complete
MIIKPLLLLFFGIVALSPPHTSISEAVKESDHIFSGKCIAIDTVLAIDSVEWRFQQDSLSRMLIREARPVYMKYLRVQIGVDSIFKGDVLDTMTLCIACKNRTDSICSYGIPSYQLNQKYLVYGKKLELTETNNKFSLPTSSDITWQLERSCSYNIVELGKLHRTLDSK